MSIIDLPQKRSLDFKTYAILLASGLSVGFTKCYLLPGHTSWYGYLLCFFIGYIASGMVAACAALFTAKMLDLDEPLYHQRFIIVAAMTLIIASLMFLLGSLGYFGPLE